MQGCQVLTTMQVIPSHQAKSNSVTESKLVLLTKPKPFGCRFRSSKELQDYSPSCLSTEKNPSRAEIDKKWFIRTGHLWGLKAGRRGGAPPWELTGLYNQRKSGGGGEELLCLSWVDVMLPSSLPPPGLAGEFSCPYMVKLGPPIIVFPVCREHVLGIFELLSSHVTIVLWWGACLLLLLQFFFFFFFC